MQKSSYWAQLGAKFKMKKITEGSERTAGKALALYAVNPGLIPSFPYNPPSLTRSYS